MRFFHFFLLPVAFALLPGASAAQDLGGCRFNVARQQFAGDAAAQLRCLLKRVKVKGAGADVQAIPVWLTDNVWQATRISPERLQRHLDDRQLSSSLTLSPVQVNRQQVRYFVIHDTSSPEVPGRVLPGNIDTPEYNRRLLCCAFATVRRKVNLIIGRDGASRATIDWGAPRPSAATKIEVGRGASARPVFVHVENIQPRAKPAGSWAWIAPQPGLTPAQEERLALAYVVASVRAGRWLMPAYHFNIDQGLPDGHDDPQNMELQSWTARVEALAAALG
jgi:hypothetical protein